MTFLANEPPSAPPNERPTGQQCSGCGHWSPGVEYGLDDGSGYCDRWEKITRRGFWCDEYVSKEDYDRFQQELAEEASEEMMDDDI